jgi:pimeloyl-ACP methyl ester carboxylesterase
MDIIKQIRIKYLFLILFGIAVGVTFAHSRIIISKIRAAKRNVNTALTWKRGFLLAEIPSAYDGKLQKAYFYGAAAKAPLIVSLHAWSSDYREYDTLALPVRNEGWNYIHPDFRGANNTPEAMMSDAAAQDIDDAISYAIENGNVDTERIVVTGHSGGGLAALGTYLRSAYKFRLCMAWCPISDLEAWYYQSRHARTKYWKDIEQAAGSGAEFNSIEARKRSPLALPPPPPRCLKIAGWKFTQE